MKNKKLSVVLALIMGTCAMPFVGCFESCKKTDSNSKTIMNVSLNPKVEFVLDEDNKVLTVNALNEEGNIIITAEAFANVEGKSADDAVKLFVEVSKETGFLIKGNIEQGENQINVSLSGDSEQAKQIFNDVKNKISDYLSKENITATINQTQAITKEQLEILVQKCNLYLKEAEVKAMEYEALINEIIESRKETKEIYSQELKNAYYEAKAFALEQAKLETLKSKTNKIAQIAIDVVNKIYTNLVTEIETIRQNHLINQDSAYQKALAKLREAKIEYLNYRNYVATLKAEDITIQITTDLANLKTMVENAETALVNAGLQANNLLSSTKEQLTTAYNNVITKIEEASIKANDFLNEISEKQIQAINTFATNFETTYKTNKENAKTNWIEMREAMIQGYQAKVD